MLKYIIIDDEKTARIITKHLCSKIERLEFSNQFSNALDAIKYINNNPIDLIFLDIHMPELNGFDFINSLDKAPNIILTTSDKKLALDAFEYNCIKDYLIKPLNLVRLKKSIERLKDVPVPTSSMKSELFINVNRSFVKINIYDIYLIKAQGDYINIKMENKDYTVHTTMKKIVNKLPSNSFIKTHRSFIVNIHKISSFKDNHVFLNDDIIPVSRSNKLKLVAKLKHLA